MSEESFDETLSQLNAHHARELQLTELIWAGKLEKMETDFCKLKLLFPKAKAENKRLKDMLDEFLKENERLKAENAALNGAITALTDKTEATVITMENLVKKADREATLVNVALSNNGGRDRLSALTGQWKRQEAFTKDLSKKLINKEEELKAARKELEAAKDMIVQLEKRV